MSNKAHSAAVRRIRTRYGGISGQELGIDIVADALLIEVETSATLDEGVARLSRLQGPRYVAVTNKEAIADTLLAALGTGIGVMDAHGNVIQPAQEALSSNEE